MNKAPIADDVKPRLCKCGRGPRRSGQRTCALCHSDYMAEWRLLRSDAAIDAANEPSDELAGVYFVQVGEFVKIGVSENVHSRLRGLRCSCPYEVIPLGFIHVGRERTDNLEATLHKRFDELWHRGEWFRLEPALRSFISEHAQEWPRDWQIEIVPRGTSTSTTEHSTHRLAN